MIKSHVTDQNPLASKQVDLVQSKKTPESSRWGQGQKKCGRCGFHHTKPEQCLAKVKKCLKCQKVGHFAAICWSKSVRKVNNSNGGGATNAAVLIVGS